MYLGKNVIIRNELFTLHPEKVMYWPKYKTLILSDTHFGKTGHFRKNGLAIPNQVYQNDLQRFFHLIHWFKADQVIIVGDFVHSRNNEELKAFQKWRTDFSKVQLHLVKGNHDILDDDWYEDNKINLHNKDLVIDEFQFVHDLENSDDALHSIGGHLHPSVLIKGIAKQSLRLACFIIDDASTTLPAFSNFSGMANRKTNKNQQIFAILPKGKNQPQSTIIEM